MKVISLVINQLNNPITYLYLTTKTYREIAQLQYNLSECQYSHHMYYISLLRTQTGC